MKVTLHQVAARAGVSIATASRALNGLAVSKPAESRVRAAAAELGYIANEAARALRSERTSTMGLIFFDLRNMLGVGLIDALSEGIEAAGYSLLIATARRDSERYDRLLRRFLERRVDALFCISPKGESESLAHCAAAGTPVIALFDAAGAFANLPLLSPTFSAASANLAEHLAGLGHRHVGLLLDRSEPHALGAIPAALKTAGIRVASIEPSEAGGMSAALAQLRGLDDPPTAVIALDRNARGLIAAARAVGLSVPEDLSVVGVTEAGMERRRLSSVVVDPRHMGRAASTAMLDWLAGAPPTGRTRVQAGVFDPRATTGPAKRA